MQILEELLRQIYPKKSGEIVSELSKELSPHQHIDQQNLEWYKSAQIYVTYPDTFSQKNNAFDSLTNKINHIKGLGCNAIHILPFLESPMIDAGFDISDYLVVRDELGGNDAFNHFISQAQKKDIHILMDVILNHTSNQHEWYQKAINGDAKYRNYYTHTASKPDLIKRYTDEEGVWAKYILNGKEVKMRIIFPEQAGDLPHWKQAKDGYWYYHTFYPHQIDLDWKNPQVFKEFARIIMFWNQKGASFRLDAIPFVGKDVFKGTSETTKFTHTVVQSLHQINKLTSPSSAFLIEAVQPIEVTKKYFGTKERVESELAYNFHLNSALWASIIGKNPQHIWDSIEITREVPSWAQWITFLRNHDQLTLEFTDDDIRLVLYENLISKGLSFTEGFGAAGRTANFLDENKQQIIMAHALLASLPGVPALYYGDEVGQTNNYKYMEQQTLLKKKYKDSQNISHDTRDINRGPFQENKLASEKGKYIYQQISQIFKIRNKFKSITTTIPIKIDTSSQHIFSAHYQLDGPDICMYINLSNKEDQISVSNSGETLLALNDSYLQNQIIHLKPYGVVWIETYN